MAWIIGRERALAYLVGALVVSACWVLIYKDGNAIKSLDEEDFLAIATNLATHGVFAVDLAEPTAYRAPGIVLFITPFVFFGADLMEARMANAVLVGLSLIALFHLVCRHASARSGLLAVILVPLWPVIPYAATTIYPQTLAAFLLVLTVLLIDRLADCKCLRSAVWAGLAFGALVLTIPIVLLLMPILLIWLVRASRRWMIHGIIFCIVSGTLVSTWTARNYLTFGAFIPVATSSGYNLLAGNAPEAKYNTSLNIRFPEYVYTEITGKNEVERNEIMTNAAFTEIQKDPSRFIILYIGKFIHWFHFSNRLMSDDVLEHGASNVKVEIREIILLASYLLIVFGPLALHIVFARRMPFRPIDYLFIALWIGAGLAYALFFTRVRFRMPFDWLIIASNAMFLNAFIESRIKKPKPRLRQHNLRGG